MRKRSASCALNWKPRASDIGGFKQWTAKQILRAAGLPPPLWQKQFFDHLLRSSESYESKWRFVCENPVRAGLVEAVEDWPYGGEIDAL